MEPTSRAENPLLQTTVDAARHVIKRRLRVLRLVRTAYEQAASEDRSIARVRDDLQTLIRLAGAWARREYQTIPWKPVLYVVAALLYFVNPADLIPDALIGIGFVDDAAVIAAVVRALHKEINAFRAWEASRSTEAVQPAPRRAA